jgi:hypothetical protein
LTSSAAQDETSGVSKCISALWGAVTAILKALMFADRILKHRVPTLMCVAGIGIFLCAGAYALPGRKKKEAVEYGTGLIVNLDLNGDEVTRVVGEVVQNGIIRGSKEYSKDEYIVGAAAAKSTSVFPEWTEGGNVFYKQKLKAIDPLNFKDSNDSGTLAVRYVIQPQGKSTLLRIDAIFMEEFRRTKHPSNGSVESAEYKDIQDRLDAIETAKKQAIEEENRRQEQLARKQNLGWSDTAAAPAELNTPAPKTAPAPSQPAAVSSQASAEPGGSLVQRSDVAPSTQMTQQPDQPVEAALQPGETLEQHIANLRHQVERLVKPPGAPLKAAPFHNASTVKVLKPGTEVLVLIDTPYWYGIETHDGEHGWIPREQLEQVQ